MIIEQNITNGSDKYTYEIQYSPFRIIQKINGEVGTIVNQKDTLMFENYQRFFS